MKYRFIEKMYTGIYGPHYSKYKGHEFIIREHYHPEQGFGESIHVLLTCTTDHNIIVQGWVHKHDLELVCEQ